MKENPKPFSAATVFVQRQEEPSSADRVMEDLQVVKVDQGHGNHIYVHARTFAGRKVILEVTDHYPFFYAEDGPPNKDIMLVEDGYKTFGGTPMKRYTVRNPRIVRDIRNLYRNPHEADIPYTQRFLVDTGINGHIKAPVHPTSRVTKVKVAEVQVIEPRRVQGFRQAWFDIETGSGAIDETDTARSPIYMICIKVEKEWSLFYWHPMAYPCRCPASTRPVAVGPPQRDTTESSSMGSASSRMSLSGSPRTVPSQQGSTSIIETKIDSTTTSPISNSSSSATTTESTTATSSEKENGGSAASSAEPGSPSPKSTGASIPMGGAKVASASPAWTSESNNIARPVACACGSTRLPDGFSVKSKIPGCEDIYRPTLYGFTEERPMMNALVRFLSETPPDSIAGWFSEEFDVPYVINRAKHLGIDRFGHGWADSFSADFPGMQHVDLLEIHKKVSQGVLKSNSLKAVASNVADIELEKVPGNVERWWQTDLQALARYNMWDVEATWAIDDEKKYTDWTTRYQFFAGVDKAMDVTRASIVWDALCLSWAKKHGFALPLKPYVEKWEKGRRGKEKGFTGGAVRMPSVGIHHNIAVADFKAMYPNIIIGGNLSYETFYQTCEGDGYKDIPSPDGHPLIWSPCVNHVELPGHVCRRHSFTTGKPGMIPEINADLFQLRWFYERKMKESTDKKDKDYWQDQRKPIKEAQNAGFGVQGYVGFRMFKKEVSEAITAFGRELGGMVCKFIESLGYEVIYSDTDSAMFKIPVSETEEVIAFMRDFMEKVNEHIRSLASGMGLLHPERFDVEWEKFYQTYLQGRKKDKEEGAKKRYAGLVTIKDWKPIKPFIEIKGFEFKRSETAPVTAEVQLKLFSMILEDKATGQQLYDYVEGVYRSVRDGRRPLFDCIKRPKIGREFDDYKTKADGIRAAEYSMEFLGMHFRKDDRVYVVPISAITGPYPKTPHVGLTEDSTLPAGFCVDWTELANKGIKEKVKPIFDLVGMAGREDALGNRSILAWS